LRVARILHISDWHVGATLYRCERRADHEAVLAQTVQHAAEVKPDLILHTGDVFDALLPAHWAMRRAIDTLQELGEIAPVVVLAGNHDHPRLFEVFARLSGGRARVRFLPTVRPPEQEGIVELSGVRGERIRVAAVPFVHPRSLDWFSAGPHAAYAERLRRINQAFADALRAGYDPTADVLLYAAHLHLAGAVLAGSERRVHVTEEFAAAPESLPPVSYAALGHIHRPQAVAGATPAAYAGSPLALDFGESGEEKSIVLADCQPGRPATITRLPITAGRALRQLTGTLEEVERAAADVGEAIVKVRVRAKAPIDGLAERLRALMPRATIVEASEEILGERPRAAQEQVGERERTLEELFEEYLAERGARRGAVDSVRALWHAAQRSVQEEAVELDLPELRELLAAKLPAPDPGDAEGSVPEVGDGARAAAPTGAQDRNGAPGSVDAPA
jgi:exonuclease SbcD